MNPYGFRVLTGITFAAALFAAAALPSSAPGQEKKVIPAAVKQTPLDEPIAWMEQAKHNFTAVKDYSCTLLSQESVGGKLQEQNVIQLKMMNAPFSIHMRWLLPKASEGQEVIYVHGKNNNKMRVKSNVLGQKILGFMSLDPQDKRVTEHSRHTILEAGIGNMIDQTLRQWYKDRDLGKTKVSIQAFVYNNRQVHKIELTRMEKDAAFYCHRTVIYLEKESKLPIRLENYDWPRQGGPAGGELLEMFSYINIAWNTGLKDADFNK
jgi:Protein of unknown function (DUF1571)